MIFANRKWRHTDFSARGLFLYFFMTNSESPTPTLSQAARQGVAVLMVTVQVVLKGVYSTPRQTNSFHLNDFKFGVNDYVPGFTNPTKFGLDRSSGGAPTWWWNIQVLWLFYFYFYYFYYYFYSRDRVQSKPMNRFWRTIAQKTQSGVRMCLLGVRKTSFGISGVFYPKNTPKMARNRDFPAKTKTSNNFETLEDRQKMSMYHDYETGCSLSESVFKICPGRTLAEIQRWRHFRLAKNLIILQTVRDRGKVTIEH